MFAIEVAWFPADLIVACAMLTFFFLCFVALLVVWIVNGFKVADDRYFKDLEDSDDTEDDVEWDHCGRVPTDEDFDD